MKSIAFNSNINSLPFTNRWTDRVHELETRTVDYKQKNQPQQLVFIKFVIDSKTIGED